MRERMGRKRRHERAEERRSAGAQEGGEGREQRGERVAGTDGEIVSRCR